ncbi:Glycosyltransferase involved in cell wall bisynthesis [Granulicella rosea]|uniref:Glycosyltransferase involved in cell wall bisynthesis n=1 Tax=Granulicella rosea TaxID=474952 RepID=A0A239CVY1_9BACT|nr:glycosyltransferase family 1 protein [Granulicella rosea]SNS23694.1 Glycosyltransferase involved in cell wall bisynthesis [Granulicella rosea]
MPRLTIDLRTYRNSGIGRYLQNLVPQLLPLLTADSIRVVTRPGLLGEAAWLSDTRLQIVETTAAVYSPQEQLLGLRGLWGSPDLLWIPHYNAPLYHRGRMVVTIHDIAPIALPALLDSELKRRYARLLIERAAAQASALLTVSEFTAGELVAKLGVERCKITVTHPGLDAGWPTQAEPHREADGCPYLLFVGNVKPNKNLTRLLEAFAQVAGRLPHRIVIAGRVHGLGTGDAAVLRQAANMGDRVRFAGEVSDAELIQLYAGAAALVLPSVYEGFGLPLLEAMQLDCPVLVSNAGSLPEVAGDAALYFDPHDASSLAQSLLAVLDARRMNALRSAGRRRLEQFSYARCAADTAPVLNHLLG